jgi:hypothetical protein
MNTQYPIYNKAKGILKKLGMERQDQYPKEAEYYNLPPNPEEYYGDQWEGWDTYMSTLRGCGKQRELTNTEKLTQEWLSKPWC